MNDVQRTPATVLVAVAGVGALAAVSISAVGMSAVWVRNAVMTLPQRLQGVLGAGSTNISAEHGDA